MFDYRIVEGIIVMPNSATFGLEQPTSRIPGGLQGTETSQQQLTSKREVQ